jgi:hypothetical protein
MREWNPATFFIVIFLLIGSMSIQMIALRNSFDRYMRQSDVKIARLREVVQRIQNGEENVDVEAMLGTGDAKQEADWEEGLSAVHTNDYTGARRWANKKCVCVCVNLVLQAIERDEVQRKTLKPAKTKQPDVVKNKTEPKFDAVNAAQTPDSKPKTASLGNFF